MIPDDAAPGALAASTQIGLMDSESLDGHTIEELSDYLDDNRTPAKPSIDNSPGCQIALAALVRLREASATWLVSESNAEPGRDDGWVQRILALIGQESRAGRDIPLSHPSAEARLSITEGAVRGLVRAAGDELGDVILGRCTLLGDVTVPGEPITVAVDASAFWGHPVMESAARVRRAIYEQLAKHTELNVIAVDVTVHDINVLGSDVTTTNMDKPSAKDIV